MGIIGKLFTSINAILNLVFCIGLFFFSSIAFNWYRGGDSEQKENLQTMLEDELKVMTYIDTTYTVMTYKDKPIGYTVTCNYEVEGKEYKTSLSVDECPDSEDFSPVFSIYYLKSDPTIISRDPQKDLDKIKGREGGTFELIATIVSFVLGLLLLRKVWKQFKSIFEKEKKEIEAAANQDATSN